LDPNGSEKIDEFQTRLRFLSLGMIAAEWEVDGAAGVLKSAA
jgi:hypothetical protein